MTASSSITAQGAKNQDRKQFSVNVTVFKSVALELHDILEVGLTPVTQCMKLNECFYMVTHCTENEAIVWQYT